MNWDITQNKRFIEAILALDSPDTARRFLRDLLTEEEITDFAKRLQVAEMLSQKIPYTTIVAKTGFSSTTIARVSKWLNDGTGGYKNILNKLHHPGPIHMRRGLP